MLQDSEKQLLTLPCHQGIIFILPLLQACQEDGIEVGLCELGSVHRNLVQQ